MWGGEYKNFLSILESAISPVWVLKLFLANDASKNPTMADLDDLRKQLAVTFLKNVHRREQKRFLNLVQEEDPECCLSKKEMPVVNVAGIDVSLDVLIAATFRASKIFSF
jgi:uncharacterized Fe-S center protein